MEMTREEVAKFKNEVYEKIDKEVSRGVKLTYLVCTNELMRYIHENGLYDSMDRGRGQIGGLYVVADNKLKEGFYVV